MALAVVFGFSIGAEQEKKKTYVPTSVTNVVIGTKLGPGRSLSWEWGPAASNVKLPRIGWPVKVPQDYRRPGKRVNWQRY